MPKKKAYYILIHPTAVFVKTAQYFEDQGGLTALWGKAWEKIYADDLNDARRVATEIQSERCVNA